MVTDRKALGSYKALLDYCREQESCLTCIFRKPGGDCFADRILYKGADVIEIEKNIRAKRKNGWI